MSFKLQILDDKRFSCHSCGNCCRHWHVQLIYNEVDRVANLRWPQGDPLGGEIITFRHGGQTFMAHKPNGDCIFLNGDNGLCRIHEQFGEAAKPTGCRLFPFSLHRTFDQKVSVIPRHDCPSVRANKGNHYKASELEKLADIVLEDTRPFSSQQCCELSEDQIQSIVDFLVVLLPSRQTPTHKAMFLYSFCDWLIHQEISELSREALGALYQPLVDHVDQLVEQSAGQKIRRVDRYSFANLISMYLRRDEDVLDKRVGRLKRATNIIQFGWGMISANTLGSVHPSDAGKSAQLFDTSLSKRFDLAPLDQLVKTRLQTLGFMGSANVDMDLLDGLRSLCLLYPLVIGSARLFAKADQPVDLAIGAIDHAFGRAPVLQTRAARQINRQLLMPETFPRLMAVMG